MAAMIDCYDPIDLRTALKMRTDGEDYAGRYLGSHSHGWAKGMTPEEVGYITRRAGMQIISNWEWNPTSPAWFTISHAVLDVEGALEDAHWLAQPRGSGIYYSVDYDAQPADMPRIQKYVDEIRKRSTDYRVGIYGGVRVVETIEADLYWQADSWSYGSVSPKAHILQKAFGQTVAGQNVDLDTTKTQDIGAWPMIYADVKCELNGKPYKAIDVNGDTYPVWTLARDAGAHITKADFGDVEIDGKKVNQVTQNTNTYVSYKDIPGITPIAIPGGHNFVTGQPAPAKKTIEQIVIQYSDGSKETRP